MGAKPKSKEEFCEAIEGVLGAKAVASALEPRCCLKIRDLDCLTCKYEVGKVLKWDFPYLGEVWIGLMVEYP